MIAAVIGLAVFAVFTRLKVRRLERTLYDYMAFQRVPTRKL